MKIGVVRRGFSATGGAENYLRRFAAEARAQGHECVLFSAEWPAAAWPDGEARTLPGSRLGFADALRKLDPRRYCDFLFSLERVWTCDCYRAGDGVHRAWLQQRAAREPFWRTCFFRWQRRHREILRLEEKMFTPAATPLVVANSQRIKREIIDTYGYPAERIRVVYNGIPAQTFDRSARGRLRRQLNLREEDYVAIFVGTGWERKGLEFACRAIEKLNDPGTHLVVLGRGNARKFPQSPRIHYVGPVTPATDWLTAADVFVLPTLYDPFSNACLEAAAAGLPVVTGVANGFSEVMRDGVHGSIVADPTDVADLAEKIAWWRDAEKRAAAGEAGRRLAAEFSIEKNAREILTLIGGAGAAT